MDRQREECGKSFIGTKVMTRKAIIKQFKDKSRVHYQAIDHSLFSSREHSSKRIFPQFPMIKGTVKLFFKYFKTEIKTRTNTTLHVFRFLNSSPKSPEMGKIGQRRSPEMGTRFPECGTRFPNGVGTQFPEWGSWCPRA